MMTGFTCAATASCGFAKCVNPLKSGISKRAAASIPVMMTGFRPILSYRIPLRMKKGLPNSKAAPNKRFAVMEST